VYYILLTITYFLRFCVAVGLVSNLFVLWSRWTFLCRWQARARY